MLCSIPAELPFNSWGSPAAFWSANNNLQRSYQECIDCRDLLWYNLIRLGYGLGQNGEVHWLLSTS